MHGKSPVETLIKKPLKEGAWLTFTGNDFEKAPAKYVRPN